MFRIRSFTLAIFLPLIALQIAGCAARPTETPPTPTYEPIALTDGLNRAISLPAPARRVVSLAPSNTEILFFIGAGPQVVGRDEFSDYPAEAASLPSVGGGFGDYNNEAIVALQPDLVLAAEINTPELVQALADLGLTVFLLPNPTSMEQLYANLETVARLTGQESQAAEQTGKLRTRVADLQTALASVTERPEVLYEVDGTDPNAPWTAGAGTFVDTLVNMAGGVNVAAGLEGQYFQLSVEELLVRNPQVIVLGDSNYGVTPESVALRPGWEKMDAVQNGRVYPFDDSLVSRPGPRLVDGLEALARLFHPDTFK